MQPSLSDSRTLEGPLQKKLRSFKDPMMAIYQDIA